jgi:hypothetical protein
MSNELKELMEQLGQALERVVRDSDQIRGIISEIEKSGHEASFSLAVLPGGFKGKGSELRRTIYGSGKGHGTRSSAHRVSAFDRRFLRALKIELPD